MCPESKIVTIFEVMDLCDQLIAQASGWLSGEHWFGLPRVMDRSVWRSSLVRHLPARFHGSMDRRRRLHKEIGGIKVVFPGNSDEGKQRITTGISESCSHPVRCGGFADRAHRPVRRDPFPGGMGQERGQPDLAGILVDGGGLHRGDLMLPETFANDIQAAREGSVAEGLVALPRERRPDSGNQ